MIFLCLPILLAPAAGQDADQPVPRARDLDVQLELADGTDLRTFGRALSVAIDRPIQVDDAVARACEENDFNFGMTLARPVRVHDLLLVLESRTEGLLWCLEDGEGLRFSHSAALPLSLRQSWSISVDETPAIDEAAGLKQTIAIAGGHWTWTLPGAELVIEDDRVVAKHWGPVIERLRDTSEVLTRPLDDVELLSEQRFAPPLLREAERRLRGHLEGAESVTLGGAGTDVRDALAAFERATGMVTLLDTRASKAVDETERSMARGHDSRPAGEALRLLRTEFPDLPVTAVGNVVSVAAAGPIGGRNRIGRYDMRVLLAASESRREAVALLGEFIRAEIAPTSWDADPDCSIWIAEGGVLWMNHEQQAHDDLCALLSSIVAQDEPWRTIEARGGR